MTNPCQNCKQRIYCLENDIGLACISFENKYEEEEE